MDQPVRSERFFFLYSLTLFLIVLIFFPLHAIVNPGDLSPMRPLLHAHALALGLWFALTVVQTRLIGTGRTGLHMGLGKASLILVAIMLPLGLWVSYENMLRTGAPQIFLGNSINVAAFALFYAMALAWRKTAAMHKRFMMLASLSLMLPALARIGYVLQLSPYAVLPMWLCLLIALPVYDLLRERRITTASVIGLILSVIYLGALISIGPPPE
jgi:hypothetical protein